MTISLVVVNLLYRISLHRAAMRYKTHTPRHKVMMLSIITYIAIVPLIGKLNINSSKHGPFLSSSSRTAPPRDILLKKPDPNIPGPDRYRVEKVDTKTNNTGLICSREARFKGIPNQTPGPAAYTVSEHTLSYSSIPYYPIVKCSTQRYITQGNVQRHP